MPPDEEIRKLGTLLRLCDEFRKCVTAEEATALAPQVLDLVPAAEAVCRNVVDTCDVTKTFREFVERINTCSGSDRMSRLVRFPSQSRIAQWFHLIGGLRRLELLRDSPSNHINAYVSYATVALNLADEICRWFPCREPDWAKMEDDSSWSSPCPQERFVLMDFLSTRHIPIVLDTLYHRAIAESRSRGEAPLAIPRLERIDKAICGLVGLINSDAISVFGSEVGMELSYAIQDAMVLVSRGQTPNSGGTESSKPPPIDDVAGDSQFVFCCSGNGYWISGFGESGFVRRLKGFDHIFRLLRANDHRVAMISLIAGGGVAAGLDAERSRDPAFDEAGKITWQVKHNELKEELGEANAAGNEFEVARIERELQELNRATLSGFGLGGSTRDINSQTASHRATIHSNLQRAYQALCKSDPPMNRLARHFESNIRSEGAAFVYGPATVPKWDFRQKPTL